MAGQLLILPQAQEMRPLYEDTIIQKETRFKMVDKLRKRGIQNEQVLNAMRSVPRHLFMPEENRRNAYVDKAYPIGEGQTITQPFTVAWQTQLLQVRPGDKVLEIGTGSAYQACILARLGAEVHTIERQKKLFEINQQFPYPHIFPNIYFYYGDGYKGIPSEAPFDKILLTAAAPELPGELMCQLKMPGLMVLPIGVDKTQVMLRISKLSNGDVIEEEFGRFSFVPMLRGCKESNGE